MSVVAGVVRVGDQFVDVIHEAVPVAIQVYVVPTACTGCINDIKLNTIASINETENVLSKGLFILFSPLFELLYGRSPLRLFASCGDLFKLRCDHISLDISI